MKKCFTLCLAALLTLSLAACGKEKTNETPAGSTVSTEPSSAPTQTSGPSGECVIPPDDVFIIEDGVLKGFTTFKIATQYPNLEIPSKIQGQTVTTIGNLAFGYANDYSIENLILPDTITKIDDGAFFCNQKLNNVVIPEGVTSIGKEAFYKAGFTTVSLPSTLTELEDGVFSNCPNLKEITIPDSVTTFDDSMFERCEALETVNLPGQIQELQWNTFGHCSSLKEIRIPAGFTKIEGYAFHDCDQLRDIYLTENIKDLDSVSFPETVTIHAPAGSYAESFAQEHNFPFEIWDSAK